MKRVIFLLCVIALCLSLSACATAPQQSRIVATTQPVYEFTTIGEFCKQTPIDVAVVCVPMDHAQEATNAAVAAGVKAIWNFTNAILEVPEGIVKEDIYFSDSLLTLEYYMAEMLDEEAKRAARGK